MRIAQELHMPLEKVVHLSVLEIHLWYTWFKLQENKQKETMDRGTAKGRNRSRR